MLLQNANIFYKGKFLPLELRVEGTHITEIGARLAPRDEEVVVDCNGNRLIPGLIDLHSHGCMGADFSTATAEELQMMRRYYASHGITSVLATTMTMPKDDYRTACKRLKTAIETTQPDGCHLLGINMEGPFLGAAKRGAHDEQHLSPIDADYFWELDALSGGHMRLVDVDPDLDGALPFIQTVAKTKQVSLAHTACSYDTAMQAIDCGATQITHLFNAMNSLHHRQPGLFGALNDRAIYAELIADGIHIHPAVLRMMFTLCPEKLVLISDSMAACGLGNGDYLLGGLGVTVQDGKATLADGTIAGSTCNVFDAMVRAIGFGVPMEAAVLSATELPARAIGADQDYGCIRVGYHADLVLLSDDLQPVRIWLDGAPL